MKPLDLKIGDEFSDGMGGHCKVRMAPRRSWGRIYVPITHTEATRVPIFPPEEPVVFGKPRPTEITYNSNDADEIKYCVRAGVVIEDIR